MCSEVCPCPAETEEFLADKEMDRALTFSNEGVTFNSFQECWNSRLLDSGIYTDAFIQRVDNYVAAMFQLESLESCSGICEPGLFWFTKPVTNLQPSKSC